jgi:hypothetical protein
VHATEGTVQVMWNQGERDDCLDKNVMNRQRGEVLATRNMKICRDTRRCWEAQGNDAECAMCVDG